MKHFYGFLSIVSALASIYLMFFKTEPVEINPRDLNLVLGFGLLLVGMVFITFMMYEEKQEEVEKLKQFFWNRSKH